MIGTAQSVSPFRPRKIAAYPAEARPIRRHMPDNIDMVMREPLFQRR
jgi:hypothetical protein